MGESGCVMGRNKSIQTFLLTLTGFSWMLLFLSITLSDQHAFRKYHAARQVVHHTPPPREQDPCALCWSATHDGHTHAGDETGGDYNNNNNNDNPILNNQHSFLGTRLAWVLGVGRGDHEKGSRGGRGDGGRGGGVVGGVGAFYYYTFHTSFTELRLRLKRAQQVAGDVREEVAALGRKVSQLHLTLYSRFSPRQDPYRRPRQATTTTPTTPTPPGARVVPQDAKTHSEDARTHTHPGVRTHTEHIIEQSVNSKKHSGVTVGKSLGSSSKFAYSRKLQSEIVIHSLHTGSHHSVQSRRLTEQKRGTASLIRRTRNRQRVYPVLVLSPSTPTPTSTKHFTLPVDSTREAVGFGVSGRESGRTVKYPGGYTRTSLSGNSVRRKSGEESVKTVSRRSASGGSEWKWGGAGYRASEGGGEGSVREWDGERESGSETPPPSIVITEEVARVVTVVVMGEGLEGLLSGLASSYPGVTVHLATPSVPLRRHHPLLRLHVHTEANATSTAGLTRILQQVTTRYVVVAAGAVTLSGLERLVWAVEHLGVWAAGGMVQSEWGEQRTSCLSTRYTYYEAVWTRGQLGTAGGCQLCHALEGPFLALTVALRHLGLSSDVSGDAGQLELFLRAAHTHHMLAAVCPSSLSTLASLPKPPSRASLLALARRHDLYSLQVPGRAKLTLSCSELSVICSGGGVALPPCCRKDLAALIRFTMDTCEAHGLLCELQEGSLLGAVKTEGVLWWERDADITFHTGNFTALAELREAFDRAGYSLDLTDNRWCCVGGRWAGGQGAVSAGRWRAELWSQHVMDAEDDLLAGRPRTRVEVDGSWVMAPTNPGLYARNRYGVEVYRHAEHWLDTGRGSGWDEYEAGKFLACTSPGHHACLDQSPPDGNLPFQLPCVS